MAFVAPGERATCIPSRRHIKKLPHATEAEDHRVRPLVRLPARPSINSGDLKVTLHLLHAPLSGAPALFPTRRAFFPPLEDGHTGEYKRGYCSPGENVVYRLGCSLEAMHARFLIFWPTCNFILRRTLLPLGGAGVRGVCLATYFFSTARLRLP